MIKEFFIPCKSNNHRPGVLENNVFFILLVLIVGLKLASILNFHSYSGADIFNNISKPDIYQLINNERTAHGLVSLKSNPKLESAAALKLNDMFRNGYFGHNSPAGITPWYWLDKVKYDYHFAGENLAMNFKSSNSTVKAWMASETHRQNILLKDFNETGIALDRGVINGRETTVVVQLFGSAFKTAVKTAPKTIHLQKSIASVEPQVTNSELVSVRPASAVSKSDPISLQKVLGSVNLSGEDNSPEKFEDWSTGGYVFKNLLNTLSLYIAVGIAIILALKIFVAIKIQHPRLVAKGLVLVALALAALLVKDELFIINDLIIK